MIACFLSNISAKYYKNPSMLSRVIAKNVGDVFFETQCRIDFLYYFHHTLPCCRILQLAYTIFIFVKHPVIYLIELYLLHCSR